MLRRYVLIELKVSLYFLSLSFVFFWLQISERLALCESQLDSRRELIAVKVVFIMIVCLYEVFFLKIGQCHRRSASAFKRGERKSRAQRCICMFTSLNIFLRTLAPLFFVFLCAEAECLSAANVEWCSRRARCLVWRQSNSWSAGCVFYYYFTFLLTADVNYFCFL